MLPCRDKVNGKDDMFCQCLCIPLLCSVRSFVSIHCIHVKCAIFIYFFWSNISSMQSLLKDLPIVQCSSLIERKQFIQMRVHYSAYLFHILCLCNSDIIMNVVTGYSSCLITQSSSPITGSIAPPSLCLSSSLHGRLSPPSSCQLGSTPPCPGCRRGWCHDYCHPILLKHDSISSHFT